MSRSTENRREGSRDGGFSLIEIVVALGIFSIVLVALLPQLVVGLRATGAARIVSQAKGISQGQLERMRHLPFHIAPAAGDYIDVLDQYFPDLAKGTSPTCMTAGEYALPTTSWSGYVAEGDPRCAYEPAGAFYRKVKVVVPAPGIAGFTVVVDTQFLSGATPPTPVVPLSGYDTRAVGKDSPASSQIGVTVTVLYDRRGSLRPISAYTQIAERLSSTSRIRSEADVRVLDLGTVTVDKVPLTFSAGLLNLTGSVSYASTVRASLAAVSAGLATGEQAGGASATLSAPPSSTTVAAPAAAGGLSTGGCAYACWGGSLVPGFAMSAEHGLPMAGTSANPAQALVIDRSTNQGISFGASATNDYRPGLDLTPPLVQVAPVGAALPSGVAADCTVAATGTPAYLSATGYLAATAEDNGERVESCAAARASTLQLFPTSFAPDGVVQIELTGASARCLVQGAGHTATTSHDYTAVVKYFDGVGYTVAATITKGQAADPLQALPLATTSIGGVRKLGDYIDSWSAVTSGAVVDTHSGGVAEIKLPGIVKIASRPVRADAASDDGLDSTSVVSMTVGALTCRAEDHR